MISKPVERQRRRNETQLNQSDSRNRERLSSSAPVGQNRVLLSAGQREREQILTTMGYCAGKEFPAGLIPDECKASDLPLRPQILDSLLYNFA
jgi:hypothetical protein